VFLLDTHVWIWSREGDERRMGRTTRRLLDRAHSHGLIRISPLSVFEVTALHVEERIHLNRPLDQWIRDAVGDGEVRIAELTMDVAIDAGHIPRTVLGDPSDRILVATARQIDATLVTADRAILAYARGGHVRVHDASR
jgi:PIN domain nuclease of toxin-antitoxin system